MSTHTQQTKKRRPYLFICILILLIALAGIFVQRFAGTDIYNKASLPSIDFGNENEADGEWCLILVNKWHPLETENEIDLTELSNGQCVDSRIYPQLQKMFDDMLIDGNKYAKNKSEALLPNTVFETSSLMMNENSGFDMKYQINKVHNLKLAARTINKVIIEPNETFSFWQLVRWADHHEKYKDGLNLVKQVFIELQLKGSNSV